MNLPFKTYSENLRWAMQVPQANQHKRQFQIREVANAVGFSYEHIRKAYSGQAALGEEANAVVCEFLGLPVDQMWELASKEKFVNRTGYSIVTRAEPPILREWETLDEDGRGMLLEFARELREQGYAVNC